VRTDPGSAVQAPKLPARKSTTSFVPTASYPQASFVVLQVPCYKRVVNLVWSGLWAGLLLVAGLLAYLHFTIDKHAGDATYAVRITWVSDVLQAYICSLQESAPWPDIDRS
jgi:hypothetical protein